MHYLTIQSKEVLSLALKEDCHFSKLSLSSRCLSSSFPINFFIRNPSPWSIGWLILCKLHEIPLSSDNQGYTFSLLLSTAGANDCLIQFSATEQSIQAFFCQYTCTRLYSCRVHCLLSSPLPGWEIPTLLVPFSSRCILLQDYFVLCQDLLRLHLPWL